MALQIWLPLNGDLHNQGLNGLKATNNGATINNNGKIGKCYYFNKNAYVDINKSAMTSFTTEASISFWVKINSWNTGYDTLFQAGLNNTAWTAYTFGLLRNNANYLCFCISNGSSSTQANCKTNDLSLNTWYHISCVYKTGHCLIYINGKLQKDFATSIVPNFSKITSIKLGGLSNNYKCDMFFNDFRIYNHALSAVEVAEIAKGLVLWYQLNDFSPLRLIKYDKNIYTESDGSKWVRIFHHNNPASKLFAQTDNWALGVYKDEDRWFDVYPIVQSSTTFEFMVKQKTTSSATEVKYRWIQNKNPLISTYDDVKPTAVTRITTSGYTDGSYGGIWRAGHSNTHMVIANTNNGNWYGATGCWTAYQGGIPGYPNTLITTGYMDLYIRIDNLLNNNNKIIYDCSGFSNDATIIGNLNTVTSSPRYNIAGYMNNRNTANRIESNKDIDFISDNNLTVSFWTKCDKTVSQVLFATSKLNFAFNTTAAYINPTTARAGFSMANFITNQWNHVVVILSGTTYSCYINGTIAASTGANNNWRHDNNRLYLLNRNYNNNYAADASISDFRIYVTALSAAAVKELYNTSMIVNSDGTVSPRELVDL